MKNYLDGVTITSKLSPKYNETIRDFANKVIWLQRHRNGIVGLGFIYSDGSLGSDEIITHNNGVDKKPAEILAECIEIFDDRMTGSDTLSRIAVNGGNGADKPNIPIYHVDIQR